LLGHIFFESRQNDQTSSGQDTSHEGIIWELADYHRFLEHFDESPRTTIRECKEIIREKLNVNLYDLLDWFRNRDSATRPERFTSVTALGEYSYVENKVFPLYDAHASRIAKPLLRKIAQFKKRRSYRYRGRVLYARQDAAAKLGSDVVDLPQETKGGSIDTGKMIKEKSDVNSDIKNDAVSAGTRHNGVSMLHHEIAHGRNTVATGTPVDIGHKGLIPEITASRISPLKKRSKRSAVVSRPPEIVVAA
jgi:hypothetical protein